MFVFILTFYDERTPNNIKEEIIFYVISSPRLGLRRRIGRRRQRPPRHQRPQRNQRPRRTTRSSHRQRRTRANKEPRRRRGKGGQTEIAQRDPGALRHRRQQRCPSGPPKEGGPFLSILYYCTSTYCQILLLVHTLLSPPLHKTPRLGYMTRLNH